MILIPPREDNRLCEVPSADADSGISNCFPGAAVTAFPIPPLRGWREHTPPRPSHGKFQPMLRS